jgi:hypothetical protein
MTDNTREVVRNQLLLDALSGPIDLDTVDWPVTQQHSSASPLEVQNETLDAIREWLNDGLFRVGAPSGKANRFVARHHSIDHSLHKISHAYVGRYDDPEKWNVFGMAGVQGEGRTAGPIDRDQGHRRVPV